MISFGASQLTPEPCPIKRPYRVSALEHSPCHDLVPSTLELNGVSTNQHHSYTRLGQESRTQPVSKRVHKTTGGFYAIKSSLVGMSIAGFTIIVIGYIGLLRRASFYNDKVQATIFAECSFPELSSAARVVHTNRQFDGVMTLLEEYTRSTRKDPLLSKADLTRLSKLSGEVSI